MNAREFLPSIDTETSSSLSFWISFGFPLISIDSSIWYFPSFFCQIFKVLSEATEHIFPPISIAFHTELDLSFIVSSTLKLFPKIFIYPS